jgi:hypothetical protein
MPCGFSKKNRHFGGTYCHYLRSNKNVSLPSLQRRRASWRTAKRASCNATSTVMSIRYCGGVLSFTSLYFQFLLQLAIFFTHSHTTLKLMTSFMKPLSWTKFRVPYVPYTEVPRLLLQTHTKLIHLGRKVPKHKPLLVGEGKEKRRVWEKRKHNKKEFRWASVKTMQTAHSLSRKFNAH